MVNEKLVDYLKVNIEKGYTIEQLKTFLIQNGYISTDIDEAANCIQTPQNNNPPVSETTRPAPEKPAKKRTDLIIIIALLGLWEIFKLYTIFVAIAGKLPILIHLWNLPFQSYSLVIYVITDILLLISVYGLWNIKKWAFDLSIASIVIVILTNLYLGNIIGIVITGLLGHEIYKNKSLYQ